MMETLWGMREETDGGGDAGRRCGVEGLPPAPELASCSRRVKPRGKKCEWGSFTGGLLVWVFLDP